MDNTNAKTRAEAVKLGQMIMDRREFSHVQGVEALLPHEKKERNTSKQRTPSQKKKQKGVSVPQTISGDGIGEATVGGWGVQ